MTLSLTMEAQNIPIDRTPTIGEMRAQPCDEGFEATKTWAAKGKADAAVKTLTEAIMRADKSKGIYAAETEAQATADEAYEKAATNTPHENVRQEAVANMVTSKANSLIEFSGSLSQKIHLEFQPMEA